MGKDRQRGLIFTVVGILLALLAALLSFSYLNRLERQVGEKTSVLVADRDIPAGTMITEDMLSLEEIPIAYIPGPYLTDPRHAIGRFPVIHIDAGGLVHRGALGRGLQIEHGMRAVTIDVNKVTGVGGLLSPGDHVDVIVSYVADITKVSITELVWQDVEVLAAGTATEPKGLDDPANQLGSDSSDRYASSPSVAERSTMSHVTLALKPEDAVKLSYLSNFGEEVRLVLRSRGDDETPWVAPTTSKDFEE